MICKEVSAAAGYGACRGRTTDFAATMYYKKAVQLEPDIESRVTSSEHYEEGEKGKIETNRAGLQLLGIFDRW